MFYSPKSGARVSGVYPPRVHLYARLGSGLRDTGFNLSVSDRNSPSQSNLPHKNSSHSQGYLKAHSTPDLFKSQWPYPPERLGGVSSFHLELRCCRLSIELRFRHSKRSLSLTLVQNLIASPKFKPLNSRIFLKISQPTFHISKPLLYVWALGHKSV